MLCFMFALFLPPAEGLAEVQACRTDWEQHEGAGVQSWGFLMSQHGAIEEYDYASIPDPYGPGWFPAPDGERVNYNLAGSSTLCGNTECRYGGEFTYFKTHIYLPPQLQFSEAWVDVALVDDGVRMSAFSPTYPDGITDPGGYAFLGGGVSSDLLPYMSSDPNSVVVLTHVDDCCSASYIEGVDFYVFVGGRPESVSTDCDLDDTDGDGWPVAGGDCDDLNDAIYPGQTESPNGIDDDCDGVIDEGTDLFDDDGDGFTEEEGDCDDASPNVSPSAEEDCTQDELDLDCDGCPGSTDPDCGGTCGEEETPSPDDDDSAGDDDDSVGDDDDLAGQGDTPEGCNCFRQSIDVQLLPLVFLLAPVAFRRSRRDARGARPR
jgi:hypothetical protein